MNLLKMNSLVLRKKSIENLKFIRQLSTATKVQDDRDYQFLQKSKIPMLHFQPSLPRLPIPDLEKTCERYLSALRPLLTDDSFERTQKIVNNFKTGEGMKLQELLKATDKENKHTSYISKPWFDMYLADRQPLPINYNPALLFNNDTKPGYNSQLIKTSNFIVSALRFYRSLQAKSLEPEVFHLNPKKSDTETFRNVTRMIPSFISTYVAYTFKAFPLDMSQYGGLFSGTRIPEIDKDTIWRAENSRHVIVMRRGHFYAVDVLNESGEIVPVKSILQRIKYILSDNRAPAENCLGVLTTENRNRWAKARQNLINLGNAESLKIIDSGLFCVCLDDHHSLDEKNPIPTIEEFLHSDGSNRWFDKSLSLLVAKDGTSAINFEHSWGDGVAVLRFFQEIYKETVNTPFVHPGDENNLSSNDDVESSVRLLNFNLDETIVNSINEAKENHRKITDSLDIKIYKEPGIGRQFCKDFSLSPDSFMQLGFQLAYFKQNHKFVSTYESCSTSAFRHGRTETMRPCTTATSEFCRKISMPHSRASNSELRELIDTCSKIHSNLTKEAAMGQGFDRHLFGLKNIAQINNIKNLDIFDDDSYKMLNYNILSTSTLSSPALMAGGFGPVVKDGYGIAYNIQNDYLGTVVSSYIGQSNGGEFIECLHSAYHDIKEIIEAFPAKK